MSWEAKYSALRLTHIKLKAIFGLMLFLISQSATAQKVSWGYKGIHGPDRWSDKFKECSGRRQSPIRIVPTHVVHNPFLSEFRLNRYNSTGGYVLSMYNNGKSAQVRLSGGAYIEGAGLDGPYHIAQFHFHWGKTHHRGSEHVIDNLHYPMELHLVHYARRYKSLENAMTKPDGLAVIGVMFKLEEFDNPNLEAIVTKLRHISTQGQSVMIKGFNLMSVLPDDWSQYYRYRGSLTTPPCYESVTWTVFRNPISISRRQLKEFRGLQKSGGSTRKSPNDVIAVAEDTDSLMITDNYRPVQELNGRIVYSSFIADSEQMGSGATLAHSVSCVLLLTVVLATL